MSAAIRGCEGVPFAQSPCTIGCDVSVRSLFPLRAEKTQKSLRSGHLEEIQHRVEMIQSMQEVRSEAQSSNSHGQRCNSGAAEYLL